MGFIDYHGTKEDRYTDVLDFAKAQQEEDERRLEEARVRIWMTRQLGDSSYAGIPINDLMKHIIVNYRKLCNISDSLTEDNDSSLVDSRLLWKDFCIALITRRLQAFPLSEDQKENHYRIFLEKVFKLDDFVSAREHDSLLRQNDLYRKYFADCFDLVQEKQFWKWMGRLGEKNRQQLQVFVDTYEQLSVLIGYYLYWGSPPENSEWMQRFDIEHQSLEKIKTEYSKGRFREPNYIKLQNPLYKTKQSELKPDQETGVERKTERNNSELPEDGLSFSEMGGGLSAELLRSKRPQLDKIEFCNLLEKKQIMGYVEACGMLRKCELPEDMDDLFKELMVRMPILQESIEKFEDVYQPDMYQFYEYYIPEALQLTATYIEYLDVGIAERILRETEGEVMDATGKLLLAVNDMIDEIYKFASIEVKARAKALESMMSQGGYVDTKFKINPKGGMNNE